MNTVSRLAASGLPAILLVAMARPPAQPVTVVGRSGQGDAAAIVGRSVEAFYAAGSDLAVRVKMTLLTKGGQQRVRELTMLRKNGPEGTQKFFLYFHSPADVRGTAFMVYKYPLKDDDRWLFIPAINLVNRIAARDSRSSFVGSDFTYEDISGRDVSADVHRLLREEQLAERGGRDVYVVESVPRTAAEYAKKLSWIDKSTFLPLKEEYYDVQGAVYKVFAADQVEEVQELPTVMRRTMVNVKSGHRTEVTFENVRYGVGLEDALFTERSLRKPPERWVR